MPGSSQSKGKRSSDARAAERRRRVENRQQHPLQPGARGGSWRRDGAGKVRYGSGHARKAFQVVSLDDYYDLMFKDPSGRAAYYADAERRKAPDPARTAHADRPPPTTSDVNSRARFSERRADAARKWKPTVQVKPISNEEAAAHLRSGTYDPNKQKSLRWLSALKAMAAGYSKTSGAGVLRAPNRGYPDDVVDLGMTISDLSRAIGVKKRSKGQLGKAARPLTSSSEAPEVTDGGGAAAELSNSISNVAIKSGGADMANVNFNDLFKSELGPSGDEHIVDCPHCEKSITKNDLAKGHKGKGKTTSVSGPKHGKSGAHVRDQNPEGGTMRGGDGRGVHAPSRGVPGAQKTDPPAGVQNSKGSRARKSDAESEEGVDKSTDPGQDPAAARPRPTGSTDPGVVKKSYTIRGTPYVQYVDDGSDAALAKSIAEGTLGGTPPTQPLDLNHDMTRLLV